jgi:3'-5' exoribonuclease 1
MRYIIVDLEATCWEGGKTSDQMEIIEIGAVILESSIGPILEEFNVFVKPVIHPVLSEYCMRLTSIRQQDVDKADDFKTVFPDFVDWIGSQPFNLCSWGAYDLKQFRADCERHKIVLPTSFSKHINLKQEFADLKRIKPCGMAKALNILGINLEGVHHRAIDDVRNIAKIAVHVIPIVEKKGLGKKTRTLIE